VKRTLPCISTIALMVALSGPQAVIAQEKPTLVPLKLQLVVSRHAGDKKVSSVPYSLWVTANETRRMTSIRMGVEVPVVTTVFPTKEGQPAPPPSYSYRSVGTNIDCTAVSAGDGQYQVHITLDDSSVHYDAREGAAGRPSTSVAGAPSFRSFKLNFSILLKDGQTAQYSSATDPVSGEVVKVDATLNVLK